MRKSRITITISGCVGVFLIAALLLVPTTQAGEVTKKVRVTSYITKVEVLPVPDVEKHLVGLYERKGVAIYENGETAAYQTWGTFDYTKGQGPFQGYSQLVYEDGSTSMAQYQGTMTVAPGAKLPTFKGTGKYIKGTGRFEGIKGKVSFSGKYITPYSKETKGDVYMEVTQTYTLP
jgi:hypothetical protein